MIGALGVLLAGRPPPLLGGGLVPFAAFASARCFLGQRPHLFGMLVKARNFLVYHGDVETIAHKTLEELVEMFKHIFASVEVRKD